MGIDGVYSRSVQATMGTTAGSGFATTELRLLLLDVMDAAKYSWRGSLGLTLYVDELTTSVRGASKYVATTLAAVVDFVSDLFGNTIKLQVFRSKSVVVTSKPFLSKEIAKRTLSKVLKPTRSANLLGTAAAGGNKRSTVIAKVRTQTF